MKLRQATFGCALSILMAIPAVALESTNSQIGSPNHNLKDMHSMSKNMESYWVIKAVQNKLQSEGYNVGRIDGMWGIQTSAALKNYQMDHGVRASGKVNQETAYLLGLDNNEFTALKEEEFDQMSSNRKNG